MAYSPRRTGEIDTQSPAESAGVPLELAVEIPGVVTGRRCIMIGELVADHHYDMAEVVVNGSREEYFNERP